MTEIATLHETRGTMAGDSFLPAHERMLRLREASHALIEQGRVRHERSVQTVAGIRWTLEALREEAARRQAL
ncbi:MAG: hypothetical protein QOG89_1104 [Thermomicrobiales bacterium]|nr:hypothetical protein [Thermomicrobiales bacterium]